MKHQALKIFINMEVDKQIDELFCSSHKFAKTTSGDESPEQALKLMELTDQLKELIFEQTVQNLEEDETEEEDEIDLFDKFEELPIEVQEILNESDGMSYDECSVMNEKLTTLGYTFEYGLDASPHSLKKIK